MSETCKGAEEVEITLGDDLEPPRSDLMDRREFLRNLLVAATGVAVSPALSGCGDSPAERGKARAKQVGFQRSERSPSLESWDEFLKGDPAQWSLVAFDAAATLGVSFLIPKDTKAERYTILGVSAAFGAFCALFTGWYSPVMLSSLVCGYVAPSLTK